jgi:hypothetical protein
MKNIFTLEEIQRAIAMSPKHIVHCELSPSVDDGFCRNIKTIEVDMFWFRLFGSNKKDWDEYNKYASDTSKAQAEAISERKMLYKFFDLPFHKRIEIAKNLGVYNDNDLELEQIKATQKWGKQIVDDKLIDQLNNNVKI